MRIPALLVVGAASALTLSACGGGGSPGTASGTAPTGGGAAHATAVQVASTSLGKVLVDAQGMTLYVLSADGRDLSTCSSSCLQFWPAVAPGPGKIPAATGRTTTPSGTPIATVAGHPVYTFALDHAPGEVNGEGVQEFGGTWYAVSPAGDPVTGKAGSTPAPSGASSSSSGYARGY
jgi:predicted lipoprotein with Yx(FWY)xxD motif